VILILSTQMDTCSADVYAYLRGRGAEAMLIDDSLDIASFGLNWKVGASFNGDFVSLNSRRVRLKDVTGILLRYMNPFNPNVEMSALDQQYVVFELGAALQGLLRAFRGPVINRPIPAITGHVFTAVDRLAAVEKAGFRMANTYIASSKEAIMELAGRLGPKAALGSMTYQFQTEVVETAQLKGAIEKVMGAESMCPMYVQEIPEGQFHRVLVVGDNVFGVEVANGAFPAKPGSTARNAEAPVAPELAERCRRLANSLGVGFCQIGSVHTGTEWICVDETDFPFYEDCEEGLRMRVAEALGDLLLSGKEAEQ